MSKKLLIPLPTYPTEESITERYKGKSARADFHLTQEMYSDAYFLQDGKCWICRAPGNMSSEFREYINTPKEGLKTLAADHCHELKRFRGLLCSSCNLGLGAFKDNITALIEAIDYLKFFQYSAPRNVDVLVERYVSRRDRQKAEDEKYTFNPYKGDLRYPPDEE